MKALNVVLGWLLGLCLLCWRLTCRTRVVNDPRPRLRAQGSSYIYALLHAHQVAAVLVNDERRGQLAAMVSRSHDGDLLVPSLTLRGVRAARGSTRKGGRDKGGGTAAKALADLVAQGIPALIAIDGPRGPRNYVHRGVAVLAQRTATPILPTLVLPSRRWFLRKTWDRFQIPRPFCTLNLIFAEPIEPRPAENSESLRARVSAALNALERRYDPTEAPPRDAASEPSEAPPPSPRRVMR